MSNNSKENAKNRNHMLEITFSTLGNKWIILTLILLIRSIYHGILTFYIMSRIRYKDKNKIFYIMVLYI